MIVTSEVNKTTTLKLTYMKKTCLFMFFIISLFSVSPLHVRGRMPYKIKGDSSEADFRTAYPMWD